MDRVDIALSFSLKLPFFPCTFGNCEVMNLCYLISTFIFLAILDMGFGQGSVIFKLLSYGFLTVFV